MLNLYNLFNDNEIFKIIVNLTLDIQCTIQNMLQKLEWMVKYRYVRFRHREHF